MDRKLSELVRESGQKTPSLIATEEKLLETLMYKTVESISPKTPRSPNPTSPSPNPRLDNARR